MPSWTVGVGPAAAALGAAGPGSGDGTPGALGPLQAKAPVLGSLGAAAPEGADALSFGATAGKAALTLGGTGAGLGAACAFDFALTRLIKGSSSSKSSLPRGGDDMAPPGWKAFCSLDEVQPAAGSSKKGANEHTPPA